MHVCHGRFRIRRIGVEDVSTAAIHHVWKQAGRLACTGHHSAVGRTSLTLTIQGHVKVPNRTIGAEYFAKVRFIDILRELLHHNLVVQSALVEA